jgi:hypothetical protein
MKGIHAGAESYAIILVYMIYIYIFCTSSNHMKEWDEKGNESVNDIKM